LSYAPGSQYIVVGGKAYTASQVRTTSRSWGVNRLMPHPVLRMTVRGRLRDLITKSEFYKQRRWRDRHWFVKAKGIL